MKNNKFQRLVAIVCVASFFVTSCTTLVPVAVPGSETATTLPAVEVGDVVIVHTKAGERKRFTVTAIEPDALVGYKKRVAYADMATLEVRKIEKGKTAAVVVIVIGVVLALTKKAADEIVDP